MPAGKSIKDRKTVADHVCDYMHENCRAWSIDTLLSRPLDALRMGLAVAGKSGKCPRGDAASITKALDALAKRFPAVFDDVDEVCRAALSSRKRGDLKRDKY
jgi:hypothetical protein